MRSAMKDETTADKSGGVMETFKGICIVILLVIAAGAGGYFYGTHQQFAPIETTTTTNNDTTAVQPTAVSGASTTLKKKYWLATTGDDHVGYAISTSINGRLVDKFFTPHKNVDITNLIKPGENRISFQAKLLPQGMREHAGQSNYYLKVSVMSGNYLYATNGSDNLLNYSRNASENMDFNDNLSFVILE